MTGKPDGLVQGIRPRVVVFHPAGLCQHENWVVGLLEGQHRADLPSGVGMEGANGDEHYCLPHENSQYETMTDYHKKSERLALLAEHLAAR